MAQEHVRTKDFQAAVFRRSDLRDLAVHQSDVRGATFRDSDLRGARLAACVVDGVRITGFDGDAGHVWVDDVDVAPYVRAELDRRHPERVRLREARTAEERRAFWAEVEELWDATVARAERLPEAARSERVDGEWSITETLRHLVFAVRSWLHHAIEGREEAHHPLGLAPTDMPDDAVRAMGLDLDAAPGWDEVVALHHEHRAAVRKYLAGLDDATLTQTRRVVMAPGEEPEENTVAHCVGVILREHVEHRRYAERDLAALEARLAEAPVG